MASKTQIKNFINQVAPIFSKYGKQYGFSIVSFAIAQACLESGYGTSTAAKTKNNLLGIGPGKTFSSYDACIKAYYTGTVLGKSSAAKKATTLDEYYKAFVASGYLGGSGQLTYYNNVKSIITSNNLTQYDKGGSQYGKGGTDDGSANVETFINECLSHKGENFFKFVGPTLGKKTREPWCADFIWACAKKVGILGSIISGSASAHLLISQTVEKCGATLHSGSSNYVPQKGDLVNFVWHGGSWADHIGVVTGTSKDNKTVYTVEGNSSDSVRLKSYARSSSVFLRFATPKWGNGTASGGSGGGDQLPENLFDYENVDEDAILREIAYAQKEKKLYQPKLAKDRIRLSIINYTDLQNAFYRAGVEMGVFGVTEEPKYDISELPTEVQGILKHLNSKGVSYSGGCGICAVISHISNFKTNYSYKSQKFGLLGFSSSMKTWVGSKWSSNVTGQLDYLLYNLNKSHKLILDDLKNMPEVKSGASQGAVYIYQNYLGNSNSATLDKIKKEAEEYFSKITRVIAVNSSGDGSNDTFDSVGSGATGKRKAAIDRAKAELGKPYAWGAVGPNSYDCSGLVGYALTGKHERIGNTKTFMGWTTSQKREPGDVVVNDHHTGLYIGDGKMIHAPRSGDVVKISGVHTGMKYVVPEKYY